MTVEKWTLLNVRTEKYCHKSIGIDIDSTFKNSKSLLVFVSAVVFVGKILLLVLTIVFTSIVNIPNDNTRWSSVDVPSVFSA